MFLNYFQNDIFFSEKTFSANTQRWNIEHTTWFVRLHAKKYKKDTKKIKINTIDLTVYIIICSNCERLQDTKFQNGMFEDK